MSSAPSARDPRITEVLRGLNSRPHALNPKWFYDAWGSHLFEEITRQPEYYLTDCELNILRMHAEAISKWMGPGVVLAELGAGNGEKATRLISALKSPRCYVPIDISSQSLQSAVDSIRQFKPGIEVNPLCLDFGEGFLWPDGLPVGPRCLVFMGSTIGNMEPADAVLWLSGLGAHLNRTDKMLIGVDLKKDEKILNAAYNDAQHVTAAFNLNALAHLNRALGANFNLALFHHESFYNPTYGRVQMHLVAMADDIIRMGGQELSILANESIHTENSYKYDIKDFQTLTEAAGFRVDAVWVDSRHWFGLFGLVTSGDSRDD